MHESATTRDYDLLIEALQQARCLGECAKESINGAWDFEENAPNVAYDYARRAFREAQAVQDMLRWFAANLLYM